MELAPVSNRAGLWCATCEALPQPSIDAHRRILAGPRDRETHARLVAEFTAFRHLEAGAPPKSSSAPGRTARIAFWNTERCRHIEPSAELLSRVGADVTLLCEMDFGMARSGQLHTTRAVAGRLSQGHAFALEFVELGLGDQRERARHAGQENTAGLHGAAIVSPHSLVRPAVMRLDDNGDWFDGERGEARIGGRIGYRYIWRATATPSRGRNRCARFCA